VMPVYSHSKAQPDSTPTLALSLAHDGLASEAALHEA
jgi:hypothetical protein